jgi:DNA-binding MarR family transcriptional regulator
MTPKLAPDRPRNEADLGLTDALIQLSFSVQSILGRVAADHDLSIVQVRVLGVLRDREPGIQQLAQHLQLDKSSVSGLIDRAERRGLVKKVAAPEDGRAVRVSPTAAGSRIIAEVEREVSRGLSILAQSLSSREKSQLSRLASKLAIVDSRGIDNSRASH